MTDLPTYADLSPYRHMLGRFELPNVRCVGWIDVRSAFPKGEMPQSDLAKLREIACATKPVKALVEPARALPTCPTCGEIRIQCESRLLPEAELWIRAEAKFYSSPVAILHYIETHKYLPPAEYLEAVRRFDMSQDFDADELYRDKLEESGWAKHTFERP